MRWLIGIVLAATCSCYTNTMMTGRPSDGVRREQRMDFYVAGLAGEHEVNLDEICPNDGAAVFGDERTFEDGLLTLVTLGIYAPRTRFVECARYGASHAD